MVREKNEKKPGHNYTIEIHLFQQLWVYTNKYINIRVPKQFQTVYKENSLTSLLCLISGTKNMQIASIAEE